MQEIWKPIKNYEELYQISNLGNMRRIGLYRYNFKKGKEYIKDMKEIKPTNDRGYLKVKLNKNGKRKTKYIHQLVAETFLENPNKYKEINHKDNNPTNNAVNNLEWCSRRYNLDYMAKHQQEIKERHERRIEALEMIYYLAMQNENIESTKIFDIISDDLLGEY